MRLAVGILSLACLSTACAPSDRDLVAAVSAQMATDPGTRPLTISVSAKDGIVELTGDTTTREEQQQAIEVASTVPGVKRVSSDLRLSDIVITAAVRRALAEDPAIGRIPIDVYVTDGVVLLGSSATGPDDRARAVALASKVDGVTKVGDLMR